jgi:hypothetical protein
MQHTLLGRMPIKAESCRHSSKSSIGGYKIFSRARVDKGTTVSSTLYGGPAGWGKFCSEITKRYFLNSDQTIFVIVLRQIKHFKMNGKYSITLIRMCVCDFHQYFHCL